MKKLTKLQTASTVKNIGDLDLSLPNENPDIENAGLVNGTTSFISKEADENWKKIRAKRNLIKLGYSFYFATLPFVFGVVVNLTGDYLTASVLTASLFIGPWVYRNYW